MKATGIVRRVDDLGRVDFDHKIIFNFVIKVNRDIDKTTSHQ